MRIHLDLLVRVLDAFARSCDGCRSVLFTSPVQHFATRTGGYPGGDCSTYPTYGPCPKLPPPAGSATMIVSLTSKWSTRRGCAAAAARLAMAAVYLCVKAHSFGVREPGEYVTTASTRRFFASRHYVLIK